MEEEQAKVDEINEDVLAAAMAVVEADRLAVLDAKKKEILQKKV